MKWTIFCGGQRKQQIHSPIVWLATNCKLISKTIELAALELI
jgi:hypothetical protein